MENAENLEIHLGKQSVHTDTNYKGTVPRFLFEFWGHLSQKTAVYTDSVTSWPHPRHLELVTRDHPNESSLESFRVLGKVEWCFVISVILGSS